MRRLAGLAFIAALPIASLCGPAWGQNTTTTNSSGSVGCTAITQAAADGLTARIAADDQSIKQPLPVSSLANSTYVLRIEATAGEQTAQQWVAFRVAR